MEDDILASAAAKGDQAAFTTLVERYRGYVYTIVYRITLHEDDALDVAQTVFLRLVERIGDFEGRGSFRSWLATIAVHEALSHRRRPQRREYPTDPAALDRLRETGGTPGHNIGGRSASGSGERNSGESGGEGSGGGQGQRNNEGRRNENGTGGGGSGGAVGVAGSACTPPAARQALLHRERRERVEAAMAHLSPQQRAIFTLRFHEDMATAEIAERLEVPPQQVRVQLCRAVARLRELVGEE